MAADLTNRDLAKRLVVDNILSIGVAVFIAGGMYMALKSDIVTAQSTADKAINEVAIVEAHSIQRATKGERKLDEIARDVSGIKANQAKFATAITNMTKNQDRILDKLDRMEVRN